MHGETKTDTGKLLCPFYAAKHQPSAPLSIVSSPG